MKVYNSQSSRKTNPFSPGNTTYKCILSRSITFFFPTNAEIAKPFPSAFPYATIEGLIPSFLYIPPVQSLHPDVISSTINIIFFYIFYLKLK